MGKVLKGSPEGAERYTLAVPLFVAPGRPLADEDDFGYSELPPEPLEAAEPEVDLAAVQAHADELLETAQRDAEAIVAQANDQAHAILDEALASSEATAEAARRAAHDDGYTRGVLEAQATMTEMLDTLRELIESVRSERHALLAAAEPELVRLAVGIAERVLHQQIALDGGVVVEMAKAAISRIVDREKITVRVNPADVERMREHRDELLALGDVKSMRVIEDQRVDRGGVLLETDGGSIDAKVSTQLAEVRKILHLVEDQGIAAAPGAPIAGVDPDGTSLAAVRAS